MKVMPNMGFNLKSFEKLSDNGAPKESFEKFFLDKIKEVDSEQKKAEEMVQALAEGKDVSLADVALSISKADLDFKLLLRIRNKILDAYQEVMRMQI